MDIKAANQLAGRFLGPGFYYKTFIRPQPLWRVRGRAAPVRERRAGVAGHAPGRRKSGTPTPTCSSPGAARPGWPPPWRPRRPGRGSCWSRRNTGSAGTCAGAARPTSPRCAELRDLVAATPGIEVLTNAVVPGRYDGNWIAVSPRLGGRAEQLIKARAKVLVVAPGLIERPYVFAGNDVPGVMLSTAVRRLINLYAVKPGRAGGGAGRQRRRRRGRRRPQAGRG